MHHVTALHTWYTGNAANFDQLDFGRF